MPENEDKTPKVDPNHSLRVAYPGNSKKSKEDHTDKPAKPEKQEKVIEGVAIKQKPSVVRRIRQAFTGDDARTVGDYLIFEVMLPALKTTISDMVSQGTNRMLFGDVRNTYGSGNRRPGVVDYNRLNRNAVHGREEPRALSQRDRATHTFDNIILGTRDDALTVLGKLIDLVDQYDVAAVSDLYEMVGVTGNFADDKWGWFDLRGADVTRVRDGWVLDLPATKPIH